MPEGKPEHPAVKVASVVGGIILVIVLMIAILAKEYLPMVGWVVIPLAVMGIVLGVIASRHRGQAIVGSRPVEMSRRVFDCWSRGVSHKSFRADYYRGRQ